MGRRGPAKTPTKILEARGSWRAKTRKGEPEADGRPTCPSWLRPEARKHWKEILPLLEKMGVLAKIDRDVLARYCQLWARWKEAEQWLAENGETYETKTGWRAYPEVKITNDLASQLGRLEGKLGLSPADRASLSINPGKQKKADGKDKSKFLKLA